MIERRGLPKLLGLGISFCLKFDLGYVYGIIRKTEVNIDIYFLLAY